MGQTIMPVNKEGTHWSALDIQNLREYARQNMPTRLIAYYLGRSEAAVYAKASELGISLHPTNQSPYGTK